MSNKNSEINHNSKMNFSFTKSQLRPLQFYRRVLPDIFVEFASDEGKRLFSEALETGHMNCYFVLAAQFITQDEPTYCGVSTLVMVLNTLAVDPGKVWKGVWRWYHERMLDCCVPIEVIQKKGITFAQFVCLSNCNHLDTSTVRVDETADEQSFRDVINNYTQRDDVIIVASYSREVVQQTGDGHFTTIGGYHKASDRVLILDVARFKYPPHWMSVSLLFEAMKKVDKETGLPRGYILLKRRPNTNPLILFKISNAFSMFTEVDSDAMTFVKRWQDFLSQPVNEASIHSSDELFERVVRGLLDILNSSPQPVNMFSTQINCDCSQEFLKTCQCIVSKSLLVLKKCTYHEILSKITEDAKATDPNMVGRLATFGNSADFNSCDWCSCNCYLNDADFLLVFLLCWPNMYSVDSIGCDFARLIGEYIKENFDDVIKNEIDGLKSQFNLLLEVWREGTDILCESASCNHI